MIQTQNSQLINAKYKLSDSEISFIVSVINQIQDVDEDFTQYRVKSSDIEQNTQEQNTKTYFKQFIKKLMSKTLEVPTKDGFLIFNWFSQVQYKEIESIFIVSIDKTLKSYLLNLKKEFLNYDLTYILPLTSNYSIKIYTLLKDSQSFGEKSIELSSLMSYLEVPTSLQRYSEFKRKVLVVAEKELKEHTDIHFDLTEIKVSRKIDKLVFYIYPNNKNTKCQPSKIITIKQEKVKKEEKNLFSEPLEVEVIPQDRVIENQQIETVISQNNTPSTIPIVEQDIQSYNLDIKRIVTYFDSERRKLQANFVRKEFRNQDGEYQLRIHLRETKRTPKMFYDAIRWLFSNNPKASFHRQYIMNISKLIEHFNTLEHQAMYSQEAIKFDEETQVWYNVYKKQGLSEDEILEKLREGGYIK